MKIDVTLKLDGAYVLIGGAGPAIAGDVLSFEKDYGDTLSELQQLTGMSEDQLQNAITPSIPPTEMLNGQTDMRIIAGKADGTVQSIDAAYPMVLINTVIASRVEKLNQTEE